MAWAKEEAEKTRTPKKSLKDEMKDRLFNNPIILPDSVPSFIMFIGGDGTGKSGLALATLTKEAVKAGKKLVVVDADGGTLPLILEHHRKAVASGNIIYYDPIQWKEDEETGRPVRDYDATIDQINAIAIATKEEHEENKNIQGVILDGGSVLLKETESIMRLEKELDVDSGVTYSFWKLRSRLFLEMLSLYKNLPFDSIVTFHTDFLLDSGGEKSPSAVKINTHALMFQKVFLERIDRGDTIEFIATIEKNKFDIIKEGKRIVFGTVDKKTEKYKWEPEKVLSELRPKKEE